MPVIIEIDGRSCVNLQKANMNPVRKTNKKMVEHICINQRSRLFEYIMM